MNFSFKYLESYVKAILYITVLEVDTLYACTKIKIIYERVKEYKELNYTWQDPKLNMPPQYVPSTQHCRKVNNVPPDFSKTGGAQTPISINLT